MGADCTQATGVNWHLFCVYDDKPLQEGRVKYLYFPLSLPFPRFLTFIISQKVCGWKGTRRAMFETAFLHPWKETSGSGRPTNCVSFPNEKFTLKVLKLHMRTWMNDEKTGWICIHRPHGTSHSLSSAHLQGNDKSSKRKWTTESLHKGPFHNPVKGACDHHFKEILYHLWSCDLGWRVLVIPFKARWGDCLS